MGSAVFKIVALSTIRYWVSSGKKSKRDEIETATIQKIINQITTNATWLISTNIR